MQFEHITTTYDVLLSSALTEWTVLDLNADRNVKLPYEDKSFDVVMCQLSIDYLIHPLEVMKEASRVLKVGACVISFSHLHLLLDLMWLSLLPISLVERLQSCSQIGSS